MIFKIKNLDLNLHAALQETIPRVLLEKEEIVVDETSLNVDGE
ncbi:hypothetical protein [Fictibacillus sp. S7]|nr:hypothetical protein [Fictibacillus sp. S7]